MVRRTPEPVLDYNRLATRVEEALGGLTVRFEEVADTIEKRINRLESDIRIGSQQTALLASELLESKIGVGELRDAVNDVKRELTKLKTENSEAVAHGAAEGAARGAGQAAGLVAAAAAKTTAAEVAKRFWSTWSVRIIAGCAGFSTILLAIKDLPGFLRGWDVFWTVVKSWK